MKCFGCFKPIASGEYCPKCKKELFNGRNINHLKFDIKEFYEYRQSQATRISISGVQDKISLRLEGNDLVPTMDKGEFILKPVPATQLKHSEDIVANEHLSMQLSKQVFKIPTAANAIIHFSNGEMAYLVKRFDYAKDGSKLDQEDFASIIGMSEETDGANYKYDSSYEAIALRAKEVMAASSSAIEDFYRRVIFNYLIGNGDAHLKNFSLYRPEGRRDLDFTPNYDLLYTKYHINEEFGEMGLELFAHHETKSYGALGFYSLEDCEVFGIMIGIPPKRLVKIYQDIFSNVKTAEQMIMESFMSERGKIAYITNFTERIQKRLCYTMSQHGFEFDSVIKPLAQAYLEEVKTIAR